MTCRECGAEKPAEAFTLNRWGTRSAVCRECTNAKRNETRAENRAARIGGGELPPFSDPGFDNLPPGEVIRLMGRAKRWLESRGFTIRLDGEYTETKVHKLKF